MYREQINELIEKQLKIIDNVEIQNYLLSLRPKESLIASMLKIDLQRNQYDEILSNVYKATLQFVMAKYPFYEDIRNTPEEGLIKELKQNLIYHNKIEKHKASYKVYPVTITSEMLQNTYNDLLKEIVNKEITSHYSINDIFKSMEEKYQKENKEYESYLMSNTMKSYNGDLSYMYNHAVYINECIKINHGILENLDKTIEKMTVILKKYPMTENKEYPYTDINYRINYQVFEEYYSDVLEAEKACLPTTGREWYNYLTNPKKHDDNDFSYLVDSNESNDKSAKNLTLVTETLLPLPNNTCGNIYEYNEDSIINITYSQPKKMTKTEFIDDGLPNNVQLLTPNAISTYYPDPENSRITTPKQFFDRNIKSNFKINGEILNYNNGTAFSSVITNTKIHPIGIYYTDGYENINELKEIAAQKNLPLIYLSLTKLRQLNNCPSELDGYIQYNKSKAI